MEIDMQYITTTFSPMMLGPGCTATVRELSPEEAATLVLGRTSAVGHEVTALVLSALFGQEIRFARVSLTLVAGDHLLVVIPSFRANEAREFTWEEVESAGWRAFEAIIS